MQIISIFATSIPLVWEEYFCKFGSITFVSLSYYLKPMGALSISLVFDILSYAVDSIFLGFFFAVLGVGLLFFLIRSIYSRLSFTPISLIVGVLLFILLLFQSIFICGAFKVKDLADDIEVRINQYIPEEWKAAGHEFTSDESQQVVDNLTVDYPLFGCYVGLADFRGHTAEDIAKVMVAEVHTFLNGYIWRRVAWSLAYILLGAFVVIKTMEAGKVISGRKRSASATRGGVKHNDF